MDDGTRPNVGVLLDTNPVLKVTEEILAAEHEFKVDYSQPSVCTRSEWTSY